MRRDHEDRDDTYYEEGTGEVTLSWIGLMRPNTITRQWSYGNGWDSTVSFR